MIFNDFVFELEGLALHGGFLLGPFNDFFLCAPWMKSSNDVHITFLGTKANCYLNGNCYETYFSFLSIFVPFSFYTEIKTSINSTF